MTAQDLLQIDVSEIAVNSAIITLKAKGLHPNFFPTLAIVMTEQGEKFCFGETVRFCSNFTVFNNKYFVDTTKAIRSIQLKQRLNVLRKIYFLGHWKISIWIYRKIEEFKQMHISKKEFLAFMGDQHRIIEYANFSRVNGRASVLAKVETDLAINSGQLAKIAIEIPSHPEYEWKNDYTNLWNVVNCGTEQLKADSITDVASRIGFEYRNVGWES